MQKLDLNKFSNFFSTRYKQQNPEANMDDSPLPKRSLSSLETYASILKKKQQFDARVSQFLVDKKIGLLSEESTKQLKLLKKYETKTDNLEGLTQYLKKLHKEINKCNKSSEKLSKQITELQDKIKQVKRSCKLFNKESVFTQQSFIKKTELLERIQNQKQQAIVNSEIYEHIKMRSAQTNIIIKKRVDALRLHSNKIYLKQKSLTKIRSSVQNKIYHQKVATDIYKKMTKRHSLSINENLKIAKETIEAKTQKINIQIRNQQMKQRVAIDYELELKAKDRLKKQWFASILLKNLLDNKYFNLMQKNAHLEQIFTTLNSKSTTIVNPIQFNRVYFQSFQNKKKLNEKVQIMEKKKPELQKITKKLKEQYQTMKLQAEQKPYEYFYMRKQDNFSKMVIEKIQSINSARKVKSEIDLWIEKNEEKLKQILILNQNSGQQPLSKLSNILSGLRKGLLALTDSIVT